MMIDGLQISSLDDLMSMKGDADGVHDPEWGARDASWETDAVLWRNGQWAVTTYGIENVKGPYHYIIGVRDLTRENWPRHMAGKNWVDSVAFDECFIKARELHSEVTP